MVAGTPSLIASVSSSVSQSEESFPTCVQLISLIPNHNENATLIEVIASAFQVNFSLRKDGRLVFIFNYYLRIYFLRRQEARGR